MKEKLKVAFSIILIIALIAACGMVGYTKIRAKTAEVSHPLVTIHLKDYGMVKMELYPEYAPNTVSNFVSLINAGYYNNKIIYGKDLICLYMGKAEEDENSEESSENIDSTEEVTDEATKTEENTDKEYSTTKISILDSSIEKDSDEDYEYEIDGEFVANGFDQNTLRHEKGVLSLNRSNYSSYGLYEEGYNSGKAQFSIIMTDSPNLDGLYCAFGRVTEGLDILEKIYNEEAVKEHEHEEGEEHSDSEMQEFAKHLVIENMSVQTFGVDYGIPETHEAFDINGYINKLYSQYYSASSN